MKPENFLIGLVLFGIVILLGFNLFYGFIQEYNTNSNSGIFTDVLKNVTVDSNNIKELMRENTQGKEVSTDDSESALGKTAYPATLNSWNIMAMFGKLLEELSKIIGIPSWIINSIIVIITIFLVMFLVYWLRGFKPND